MPRPAADLDPASIDRRRPSRPVAAAVVVASAALLLSGCASTVPSGTAVPSSSSATPWSPPTPVATDALTLSQAVAAILHERGVPVDGLDCVPTGSTGGVTTMRCVVTTGADDPEQVATVRWRRGEGAVEVVAVDAALQTPQLSDEG